MRSNTPMIENLPDGITATTDPGGRTALLLRRGDDEVMVSLLGAQVLSWHHASRDVLWSASNAEYLPGKPVRGGVPIVFPWFGDHATDEKLPAHGFVRNLTWRLAAASPEPAIVLETNDDAATRTMWPFAFRLRFTVTLKPSLHMSLSIENCGPETMSCEEALHTYFAVGDVHTAEVHGLADVAFTEHAKEPEASWDPSAPLRFRAETDRIFQAVPDRIELRTPAQARNTVLTCAQARSAIVWNPWPAKTARLSQMAPDDWQRFVCIESANVREHRLCLAPGATHTMTVSLSLSS